MCTFIDGKKGSVVGSLPDIVLHPANYKSNLSNYIDNQYDNGQIDK